MGLSCHKYANILSNAKGAGNNPRKCVNQHLTAELSEPLLGLSFRSVSVISCIHPDVRDYWKGRAVITALTDRRRQSCRILSKPSWLLACSQFFQLALSKKKSWLKSPWSWKSQKCRNSDLRSDFFEPGPLWARLQLLRRQLCQSSKLLSHLALLQSSLVAHSRKKKSSWSTNRSWKKRQCRSSKNFAWSGAYVARPTFPTFERRGIC